MNAEPNSHPPPLPAPPPNRGSNRWIVAGFLVGAFFWVLPIFTDKYNGGYGSIPPLLFACFVLPVASVILAIIKRTRRFGLGLLLASGLGWLVLGAMCGGLFR